MRQSDLNHFTSELSTQDVACCVIKFRLEPVAHCGTTGSSSYLSKEAGPASLKIKTRLLCYQFSLQHLYISL